MDKTVDLVVVGLSHRSAPVAVRERLAVVPEQLEATLRDLVCLPGVREAALLGTCNRVEIYVAARDTAGAVAALRGAMAARAELPEEEIEPHFYCREDAEGVHHLFRVAASLDSLVVGEPQILGQVKDTYDAAVRFGTAGPILDACFSRAFRVARRVRRETAIAKNPVSVSSVAVELARQIFGGFEGRTILIVGAGKMSALAARALVAQGATLVVTNRTAARAEQLAAALGCQVHPWEDLSGAVATADVVLASTGAREPVLTRAMLDRAQRARRGRPLLLIDIAVPRDVDPACAELEGVYLADIDDLQKIADQHRADRRSEADRAEAIVEQELARFLEAMRARRIAPTIAALRSRVLGIAQAEAERVVASLPQLGERERRAILELAECVAKKVLHAPQMALKKDTGADGVPLALAVQRLFELTVVDSVPADSDASSSDAADGAVPAAEERKEAARR